MAQVPCLRSSAPWPLLLEGAISRSQGENARRDGLALFRTEQASEMINQPDAIHFRSTREAHPRLTTRPAGRSRRLLQIRRYLRKQTKPSERDPWGSMAPRLFAGISGPPDPSLGRKIPLPAIGRSTMTARPGYPIMSAILGSRAVSHVPSLAESDPEPMITARFSHHCARPSEGKSQETKC